jgi:hypothetical protein
VAILSNEQAAITEEMCANDRVGTDVRQALAMAVQCDSDEAVVQRMDKHVDVRDPNLLLQFN